MSVYPHKGSPYFHYDFQHKGRRYTGSTNCTNKRAAEAVERKKRQDAALGRLDDGSQLTLDQAVGKWWEEVGQHLEDGKRGPPGQTVLEKRLENLLDLVGAEMRLADIEQVHVAAAIEKRRGQGFTRSPKKGATVYYPANATVNRDVINTLREILGRSESHWGARGLPKIAWGQLALDTPRETVRVYKSPEISRWMDEATRTGWYKGETPRPDAADVSLALDLILTYGLRVNELFFHPSAYDPGDPADADGPKASLEWMIGRKKDVPHVVPLIERHSRAIAALVGRAVELKLAHIWFYQDGKKVIPITKAGLTERLNNAAARAGIEPGRLLHGGRHHVGTTFQRKHGDRKLTQRLLGHLDSRSTDRYVHMDHTDVRQAFDDTKSRHSPEPQKPVRKKRRRVMGL